jgi:hypothetical protein
VDEDRLSPELGRLIDAAKAAAEAARAATRAAAAPGMTATDSAAAAGRPAGVATPRAEGWAVLVGDGTIHTGSDAAAVLSAAQAGAASSSGADAGAGLTGLLAAAFAVSGEGGDTLLPGREGRAVLGAADPGLPIVVKHLGRWVAVPLSELPPA